MILCALLTKHACIKSILLCTSQRDEVEKSNIFSATMDALLVRINNREEQTDSLWHAALIFPFGIRGGTKHNIYSCIEFNRLNLNDVTVCDSLRVYAVHVHMKIVCHHT